MPAPPRTVSVPNLHLPLCVWKPLKAHAICFIAGGNVFSDVLKSTEALKKYWSKTVQYFSHLGRFFLSLKSTVQKENVVHWRTLQIFPSAIHDMSGHTGHLFASSASCYQAERISCKSNWELEARICGLATTEICRYTLVPQALRFSLMSLSHALDLGQLSVTHTKNFLTHVRPVTSSTCVRPEPARIALLVTALASQMRVQEPAAPQIEMRNDRNQRSFYQSVFCS